MTAFDLNAVKKVRDSCESGNVPMTEDVVSFLLGYHFQELGSDVAFQVGRVSSELGFSPDVDLLEIDNKKAIGYEIKGVQKDGKITKDQLYKGLGQSNLLLTRPLTFECQISPIPELRKSYLVYPYDSIEASEEWVDTFIERINDVPSVGLITLKRRREPEIIVDAEPNIPPKDECADLNGIERDKCLKLLGQKLKSQLLDANTGKSVKNPQRSLEVLARKIADEHDIDLISLT